MLGNGQYYITNVGRTAEANAACGTYMGYGACGTGTGIAEMTNAQPTTITWSLALITGNAYTIRAFDLEACSGTTYLGSQPCSTNSNAVALAATNDGTGDQVQRQQAMLDLLTLLLAAALPLGSRVRMQQRRVHGVARAQNGNNCRGLLSWQSIIAKSRRDGRNAGRNGR